ncbi:Sorting nexin, cytoplasm-to-vacuole targeting pathway/endosomal sorting [Tilletia horrida]|nr:Sorting nexin, cytoplasm-to-vacuole targeting pathway/endosomal sorting [Tilletia horrida]
MMTEDNAEQGTSVGASPQQGATEPVSLSATRNVNHQQEAGQGPGSAVVSNSDSRAVDESESGSMRSHEPLPPYEAPSSSGASAPASAAAIAAAAAARGSAPLPPPPANAHPSSATAHSPSLSTGPLPDYSTLAIVDALKSSDQTGKSFIVYLIRCGASDAKRRYSEFEALREALVRLFPCYIVPPIPGKHTFGDYATKPSTAKDDAIIISRRRRMLGSFLQRCANHSVLNRSIVFQRFLDGRFSWYDITISPPLSLLPKSNLRGPASDPTSTPTSSSLAAYATAPLPAANSSPREPNKRFLDSEAFTNRFAQHLSTTVEKADRRLLRRWTELSADFAELGALLNVFSMTEAGSLAAAIERVGAAADSSYLSATNMVQEWEEKFAEPLQEYVQFAAILQKMLKWRTQKHVQYELALDTLEIKRAQLDDYERVEREALRIDVALARGGRGIVEQSTYAAGGMGSTAAAASNPSGGVNSTLARQRLLEEQAMWSNSGPPSNTGTMRRSLYGAAAEEDDPVQSNPSAGATLTVPASGANAVPGDGTASSTPTPSSGPPSTSDAESWTRPDLSELEAAPGAVDLIRSSSTATVRSGSVGGVGNGTRALGQPRHRGAGNTSGPGGGGSGGILGALSHTFASIISVDPDGSRRNNVSKLRETVILLEEAVELLAADLEFATTTIQADLDRFQRQKVVDFKNMMISFAKMHRELCRQNLEAWHAAKAEISRIDTDSAMPESSLTKKEREDDDLPPPPVPRDDVPGVMTASFTSAGLEAEEGGF